MKAVIFAGGTGTRLWPLSRKKSPKQFEKIIGDKSTLQLAVSRLYPEFSPKDIYISTNIAYKNIIKKQLSEIPEGNFIFEPEKRDVGPAVAFVMAKLLHDGVRESVVILWSDHLVRQEKKFKSILKKASFFLKTQDPNIVFIGHAPRFASDNLGWIHYGKVVGKENNTLFYSFEGFKYKPDKHTAQKFLASGHHAWNLGYFVTTPKFIYDSFKRYAPNVYSAIESIFSNYGTAKFNKKLANEYGKIEAISFDNAVLEQLERKDAAVVVDDIGWSDLGAWEALKEALEQKPEDTITKGRVYLENASDSLVYNYQNKKLVVGIDLDKMLVVNTDDVLLVAKKTSVPKIKKVVEGFTGTENEDLI